MQALGGVRNSYTSYKTNFAPILRKYISFDWLQLQIMTNFNDWDKVKKLKTYFADELLVFPLIIEVSALQVVLNRLSTILSESVSSVPYTF